jgi:hypothetical protein
MLVSLFDLPCCESEREILGLRELGVRMSVQKEAIAGPNDGLVLIIVIDSMCARKAVAIGSQAGLPVS